MAEREVMRFTPSEGILKLPALAERLSVAPLKDDVIGAVVLVMKDGRRYDIMELMNAFLDRIDQALLDTMVDKL